MEDAVVTLRFEIWSHMDGTDKYVFALPWTETFATLLTSRGNIIDINISMRYYKSGITSTQIAHGEESLCDHFWHAA
jgi:hypothetical protein